MKTIRNPTGTTKPWPEVLQDFNRFTSVNPEYEPMRRLVHDLHSCAASDLHATQTMGGNLLVSPEEELYPDDNILIISYYPKDRRFHFEHRTISENNDSKDASVEEAWNILRLFVGYKFGIRLPDNRPNARGTKTDAREQNNENENWFAGHGIVVAVLGPTLAIAAIVKYFRDDLPEWVWLATIGAVLLVLVTFPIWWVRLYFRHRGRRKR